MQVYTYSMLGGQYRQGTGAVLLTIVQYSILQYRTVQYIKVKYSPVHFSPAHQNSRVHNNALIARTIGGIPDQRVTALLHCAVVHIVMLCIVLQCTLCFAPCYCKLCFSTLYWSALCCCEQLCRFLQYGLKVASCKAKFPIILMRIYLCTYSYLFISNLCILWIFFEKLVFHSEGGLGSHMEYVFLKFIYLTFITIITKPKPTYFHDY